MEENKELLEESLQCWRRLEGYRRSRTRNKNYTFGNQWCDRITVDGMTMTEEEYIVREGNIPLKNNLIRRLVRNIIGVFRDRYDGIEKRWGPDIRKRARRNSMEELYGRSLEEFLISGMVVHRKTLVSAAGVSDVRTDIVSPDSFFLDCGSRDPRGHDVRILGQLHELPSADYFRNFVKNRAEYEKAVADYGLRGRIRVVEVWKRELRQVCHSHDRLRGSVRVITESPSPRRGCHRGGADVDECLRFEEIWRYHYLNERGEVLREGDSPLAHRGHPYVFKCYPFLDGEIHSFVSDVIDQQRYTNRLITLYDWIMRASAKGVLLFPEESLPSKGNLDEIADEWSRFNGVITYKARTGIPAPMQVNSTTPNSGISDLLSIQLRMMEDISGIHDAIQGKSSRGSVSGTLYNQQKESSMTSLRDVIDSYESFIREGVRREEELLGAHAQK